jgi:prephenate dehydrogenase
MRKQRKKRERKPFEVIARWVNPPTHDQIMEFVIVLAHAIGRSAKLRTAGSLCLFSSQKNSAL